MSIGLQLTGVQGPMARRVADLRAAFEVLAGPTWRDPWSVAGAAGRSRAGEPDPRGSRDDPGGLGTAAQVQEGILRAAAVLADAGYAVEELEPPSIDAAAEALLQMNNTPDVRAMWDATSFMLPDDTQRFLTAFYEAAGDPDPATVLQSFVARQAILRAWGRFQEDHPLIVGPIFTDVPFGAGTDLDDGMVAETIRGLRLTLAVNALGLPSVAVPVGVRDGLPQAVQVIGPRYREDLCLDAAAAIGDRLGVITPIDPR